MARIRKKCIDTRNTEEKKLTISESLFQSFESVKHFNSINNGRDFKEAKRVCD